MRLVIFGVIIYLRGTHVRSFQFVVRLKVFIIKLFDYYKKNIFGINVKNMNRYGGKCQRD